jgi:hypothetical protein
MSQTVVDQAPADLCAERVRECDVYLLGITAHDESGILTATGCGSES